MQGTDPASLLEALRQAVSSTVEGEGRIAVAYSGGVDSSLLARLTGEVSEVQCYTCAMRGSFDALNAQKFAEDDGLEHKMILIDKRGLPGLVGRTARALNTEEPVRIAYSIPILCVIELSEERTVLAGCGADEVFGGYEKYSRTPDPVSMMRSDLAKMLDEDRAFVDAARAVGKRYAAPFVNESVLSLADSLPITSKVAGGERKILLRKAARSLGLDSHNRKKKAAQYSTGVLKEMTRLAKTEGESLGAWVRELAWDVN